MPGSYFHIRAVAQRAQYITTWENCMKCSMFCQVAVHRGLQSLHSVYTLNKKKCIASTALNLVVNILNVERCFRVSSGGTTSNASSWQLYCFEEHLPSHVARCSAVQTRLVLLLCTRLLSRAALEMKTWMNEWVNYQTVVSAVFNIYSVCPCGSLFTCRWRLNTWWLYCNCWSNLNLTLSPDST